MRIEVSCPSHYRNQCIYPNRRSKKNGKVYHLRAQEAVVHSGRVLPARLAKKGLDQQVHA